jgi:hypothetical protein
VTAFNMSCQSARNKLRRWMRRERLPRNRNGWHCSRIAVRGRNRQCVTDATRHRVTVGFVWRQRRR